MVFLKRWCSVIICIMLVMSMSFGAFADNEDYCCDEDSFVQMTDEEINDYMLALGIGFNKIEGRAGTLTSRVVSVTADYSNNRIMVFFSTVASMVANEIGCKNLRFYRKGTSSNTLLRSDAKLYTGFQQMYTGGYYYTSPVSGAKYYAEGTNYGIFTTTEVALHTTSSVITY